MRLNGPWCHARPAACGQRLRLHGATAWNPRHNGVKRQEEGTRVGYFGALNFLHLDRSDPEYLQLGLKKLVTAAGQP